MPDASGLAVVAYGDPTSGGVLLQLLLGGSVHSISPTRRTPTFAAAPRGAAR